jgi:hypothetical protein
VSDYKLRIPIGEHPFDPGDAKFDPICWELVRVQAQIFWIDDYCETIESMWNPTGDDEKAQMHFAKDAIRQAVVHFQRLKELLLAGVTIDRTKNCRDCKLASVGWEFLNQSCLQYYDELFDRKNKDASGSPEGR